MLNEAIENVLNAQIQREFESAYLYLSMAAYFEAENLPGFAHWMRMQSEEEREHAMRLFDYVLERGGRPQLQAIDEPPGGYDSPFDAVEQALDHERKITESIHQIYARAVEENDYATQSEMQWFVEEQVEEEQSAAGLVAALRQAGDDSAAMFILDRELGER
jgi:ferritin